MRRFILVADRATADDTFLLDDIPSTSGRLDVLVRAIRCLFLTSHGLRRDVDAFFVLGGGPRAPRVVRLRGHEVRFLRPDERAGAGLLKKVLASHDDEGVDGFMNVKPGIDIARGGLELALDAIPEATLYRLDEHGPDLRIEPNEHLQSAAFLIGDPDGFSEASLALLGARGARAVSVGPTSLHAEDVVTLIHNELDRRGAR